MKKRIFAVILIVVLMLSVISFIPAFAENEEDISEEKLLIDSLLNDEAIQGSKNLTRGEYMLLIAKLTKTYFKGEMKMPFKDVDSSSEYANAISFALSQEWISAGEFFEPDRAITPYEAIKVAVCVIGREMEAIKKGGYPGGYLAVANAMKITKGWHIGDSALTGNSFYKLAFQMMKAQVLSPTFVNEEKTVFEKTDDNLLGMLYGIGENYGIVTKTSYNSYDNERNIDLNDTIEINGIEFKYKELGEEYLGLNCKVYYCIEDGERKAVCIYPYINKEVMLERKNVCSVSETKLSYYEDNKREQYTLKNGYLMIYNGRLCDTDESIIKGASGTVRLLDNDNDGQYDVMFVEAPQYLIVKNFDSAKQMLIDENSKKYNIELEDTHIKKITAHPNGENINFEELKGKVIAVLQSIDKKLTSIYLCTENINGKIETIDSDENKVGINGEEYNYSDYLKDCSQNQLRAGMEISCVLGMNGEIAAIKETENNWQYGYIVNSGRKKGIRGEIQVKLFTETGDMQVINLASKVKADGENNILSDTIYSKLTPQLIRYKQNADGVISAIDFSEDNTGNSVKEDLPENNYLTCYYKDISSQYKSNSYAFVTNISLMVEKAKVFVIPSDLNEEEDFSAGSYDVLASGRSYDIKGVYNVDEYGGCEAIVVGYIENAMLGKSASYLIENIKYASNEDGEWGRNLYCWSNGKYTTLFLPDDVAVRIDNGGTLSCGDIIRVQIKNKNEIAALEVDVDFVEKDKKIKANTSSGGVGLDTAKEDVGYSAGTVYSSKGNYINLIPFGTIGDSFNTRKTYYTSTTNIVRYNFEEKRALPITIDDIRGKLSYKEPDYAVLRQSEYATSCIFIYEGDVTE